MKWCHHLSFKAVDTENKDIFFYVNFHSFYSFDSNVTGEPFVDEMCVWRISFCWTRFNSHDHHGNQYIYTYFTSLCICNNIQLLIPGILDWTVTKTTNRIRPNVSVFICNITDIVTYIVCISVYNKLFCPVKVIYQFLCIALNVTFAIIQ